VQDGSVTTSGRIFSVAAQVRPSTGEPIRSVVLETESAAVVVWHAHPGQEIAAHVHPRGQDTWTVIAGEAEYYRGDGMVSRLAAGDIAIAGPMQVHGARNTGSVPFIFVSVVSTGDAGFMLADK